MNVMIKVTRLIGIVAFILLGLCTIPSYANPYSTHYVAQNSYNEELPEAVRNTLRQHPNGRLLKAEKQHQDGRSVYQIRILTPGGKVRNYSVDDPHGNGRAR